MRPADFLIFTWYVETSVSGVMSNVRPMYSSAVWRPWRTLARQARMTASANSEKHRRWYPRAGTTEPSGRVVKNRRAALGAANIAKA